MDSPQAKTDTTRREVPLLGAARSSPNGERPPPAGVEDKSPGRDVSASCTGRRSTASPSARIIRTAPSPSPLPARLRARSDEGAQTPSSAAQAPASSPQKSAASTSMQGLAATRRTRSSVHASEAPTPGLLPTLRVCRAGIPPRAAAASMLPRRPQPARASSRSAGAEPAATPSASASSARGLCDAQRISSASAAAYATGAASAAAESARLSPRQPPSRGTRRSAQSSSRSSRRPLMPPAAREAVAPPPRPCGRYASRAAPPAAPVPPKAPPLGLAPAPAVEAPVPHAPQRSSSAASAPWSMFILRSSATTLARAPRAPAWASRRTPDAVSMHSRRTRTRSHPAPGAGQGPGPPTPPTPQHGVGSTQVSMAPRAEAVPVSASGGPAPTPAHLTRGLDPRAAAIR
mmetsp:Transcript_7958/g.23295  ORF Transcript_7958/g.23295 Transcript_7958/m.23295 type:complete len:404 (+) Transcript_7958:141-1352(+)